MAEEIYRTVLKEALAKIAPGTVFRQGIENVKEANTGALIVVGDSPKLMELVSGGFDIDCEFTPSRLYELAKMDGAIIIAPDLSRILKANVQLDPDTSLPTTETGIRHRTASRVAQQTGELVIAISQRRAVVTLFLHDVSFRLREISALLAKSNQALQTLEKYHNVFTTELQRLGGMEFEDIVTVADACELINRGLRVVGISEEVNSYIVELGAEGRLVRMQLDEMMINVEKETRLIIKDYNATKTDAAEIMKNLLQQQRDDACDAFTIARALGLGSGAAQAEQQISPRGYRMLSKIPRIPPAIIENLVDHFKQLLPVTYADIEALDAVEGIGEARARTIRNGLKRLQEQLMLDYMI
ncbi:MAG: DNA integrity scanning diadenylate cyclase DisA [Syntrophomonadaceae bacterium]|nr:DNA integrity scanning diadenylate cyclase DisA [Syntrophomonadaceae bacterium]